MGQLTSADLVSAIMKHKSLSEAQVAQMMADFKTSFAYENEPNILRLLAQELNIDLGSPNDYLYLILEYCIGPLRIYIYPFSTINKEEIKRAFYLRDLTHKTSFTTIAEKAIDGWTIEPDEQYGVVYGRNGIVILICIIEKQNDFPNEYEQATQSYKELFALSYKTSDYIRDTILETVGDCTLDEVIDKTRIKTIFSGYRVLHDRGAAFIPISVLEDVVFSKLDEYLICRRPHHAPEFPFISLEPLKDEENFKVLRLPCTYVQAIKGLEVLRNRRSVKRILIEDRPLFSFDLPALGVLPNLEEVSLCNNALEEIDLSSLSQSPKLKKMLLGSNRLKHIDLSPLMNSPSLEYLSLVHNEITDIDLSPLRHCKKLKKLRLFGNPIESFNLTPLLSCVELKEVILRDDFEGPPVEKRIIPPLVNGPQQLTIIGFTDSDHLDLSDKEVVTELTKHAPVKKPIDSECNNGLIPTKSNDFDHTKVVEFGKMFMKKEYAALERDFRSDADSILFAARMAVMKGSPIHDPNWLTETLELPKNTLGFLGLTSCYSNPNVLALLRQIIRNGDEIHPEVWNFASMKFTRYLNDKSFADIHAELSNEYFSGKIKHDQLQKFLQVFLKMHDPAIESSDPFELFKDFLANPEEEFRCIVFKFFINMYFADLNLLVANTYLGMHDPSKKVQNTVKKTLSDRFGSNEKAEEFIQEILSSPQEQLDEILKEIHSED